LTTNTVYTSEMIVRQHAVFSNNEVQLLQIESLVMKQMNLKCIT